MEVVWIIFLFVLGSCVGSFLNVVIYRLPRGESVVFPPSHCPKCGRPIRWYDNIPLLSWVLLRGKCRFCKAKISPRYLTIEAATAGLVTGLYVCYYVLGIRQGVEVFSHSWPTFLTHAALLCALLACSIIDIEHWIVPLEVCWVVSVLGIAVSAAAPHQWIPKVSAETGAMSIGALIGLAVGLALLNRGWLRRSFIDAEEPNLHPSAEPNSGQVKESKAKPKAVAVTKSHGVNPRIEVLRELLFLLPAISMALIARALLSHIPSLQAGWHWLTTGTTGLHVNGLTAALFGYLVAAIWIWGVRILGTLVFGKEAMGLGDVHLLAAVGAVTGWIVPSIAFFLAPFFALAWAVYLWLRRNQRELPYGPWLATATLVILIFYDLIIRLLGPYAEIIRGPTN